VDSYSGNARAINNVNAWDKIDILIKALSSTNTYFKSCLESLLQCEGLLTKKIVLQSTRHRKTAFIRFLLV
jgi:hypothetical protein